MKKFVSNLSIATLIVGLAFSFGSCEKTYECKCEGGSGIASVSSTTEKEFSSEDDAQSWCDNQESSAGSVTISCTLSEK